MIELLLVFLAACFFSCMLFGIALWIDLKDQEEEYHE